MDAAPGIAVTQAEKNWIRRSRIAGLRDPAVADPTALALAAGVDPTKLRFEWKDYLALDDASVLRRFEKRFGKPAGTNLSLTNGVLTISGAVPFEWYSRVERDALQSPGVISMTEDKMSLTYDPAMALGRLAKSYPIPSGTRATIQDGTLHLAGTAPYEWLASVRGNADKFPGISRIAEDNFQVIYDSRLVLQRFSDRFSLPDSVNASVENGVLFLSGEAPHAWLTRVRRAAPTIPGIKKIDERNLLDVDQQEYQQSKSVIESAFIYFLPNKDNFATEGFAALSRLPDEIRRALTATKRLALEVQIEVHDYADSVGDEKKNFELSQRRSDAVRDFLVKCGFDSSLFNSLGMGAPSAAEKAAPEQFERRVALKVVPKL
ncbi:MAG: OmpA family protein [Chthoniobacterales bacterium]|nr:OmpA family protein [Chthoniobacterales bacterium]